MTRLSARLSRISSGKVLLAAAALFVFFLVFVLPSQAEVSSLHFQGAELPDTSLIYSAEQLHGWAEAYGEDGREAYLRARWTFDLVWPVAYGFFLVTAISWVGRRAFRTDSRANLLNLIPIAAVFLDYAENVAVSVVMLRYPDESVIAASLASPITAVKWVFVGVSFLALLGGVFAWTTHELPPTSLRRSDV